MANRSPLIWRLMKAAAFGGAAYLLFRGPDAPRRAKRAAKTRSRLQANAERALAMKMDAAEKQQDWRPPSRTADEGMRSTPNKGIAPSGAFDAEGFRPAYERGGRGR